MDLAVAIYEKAKQMEEDEKSKNYIEFNMKMHISADGDVPCFNKEQGFKIYPVEDYPHGVIIEYNGMRWSHTKKSGELDRLLLTILRQILREFLKAYPNEDLVDEILQVDIKYKQQRVFFDEYLIMDNIGILDLSCNSLYECNDNDELKCIHRLFQNYVEVCMGIRMLDGIY